MRCFVKEQTGSSKRFLDYLIALKHCYQDQGNTERELKPSYICEVKKNNKINKLTNPLRHHWLQPSCVTSWLCTTQSMKLYSLHLIAAATVRNLKLPTWAQNRLEK